MSLPDGVLKSVVCSTGEHPVGAPQLLDVPEALELWSVDDLDHQWVELNVSVDGIIEDLDRWTMETA